MKTLIEKLKALRLYFVRCSCVSLEEIILKHSFPNGKDENGFPKFRMKHPDCDYVMNMELTKVIRVIEVNNYT